MYDSFKFPVQVTKYYTNAEMLEKAYILEPGTMAFVLDDEELYIRVKQGMQQVPLVSFEFITVFILITTHALVSAHPPYFEAINHQMINHLPKSIH